MVALPTLHGLMSVVEWYWQDVEIDVNVILKAKLRLVMTL